MPPGFFDPGQLTARLVLEAPAEMADGQGGTERGFVPVGTLWARIDAVSVDLEETGSVRRQVATHRILTWSSAAIATGMRFRLGDRCFEVQTATDPDGTGRFILCTAREESA